MNNIPSSIRWDDDVAAEWEKEDATEGWHTQLPSREEEMPGDVLMTAADIVLWQKHAKAAEGGGEGWQFGRRLFGHLSTV